ncbi:SDR family oxidoreductase [Halodurantibacterium flavum]|uniref:SDR family oxidoreductase n=1 Tax=Halodurantibacterium flavum TaxID=1382802 RepID=A0ABW4S6T6_9RHOB
MNDMRDKVILITGASRGIGAATARVFFSAGARLVLLARDRESLDALSQETGALAVTGDVADPASMELAVATAYERFGSLDVLVNNAGIIGPIASLAEADASDWGQAIDVNLKGVYHGMRAALPVMRAQGGGTILTVGSGAAHTPREGWSAYCASKAGALMLTKVTDQEARADGIRALSLSPGTVATDMQQQIRQSGINPVSQLDWSAHIPPKWAARALLWMCGPEADDFLGQEVSLRDEDIRRRIGLG